jgi:hypothetical protein
VIKDCVLDNPTAQQIFDYVFEGLYKQGHRAYDTTHMACQYKTSDGSKCAVGMLLTDEYYERYEDVLEGANLADLISCVDNDDNLLLPTLSNYSAMLGDLQDIHDMQLAPARIGEGEDKFRDGLIAEFKRIAEHYNLNTDRIKHHEA